MGHSPIPQSSVTVLSPTKLTFPEAIQAIVEGKRVSKSEWNDPNIYCQERNGRLMIHLADGWHQWIVNDGDLHGEDWFILDE